MKPPKGKHFFGSVKVGEKGQIVIPAEARKIFNINPGDTLVMLGDEKKGLAVLRSDDISKISKVLLDMQGEKNGSN